MYMFYMLSLILYQAGGHVKKKFFGQQSFLGGFGQQKRRPHGVAPA
jgi:hypothetical protein